ncbi:MAG TPA: hypothetical protein VLE73_03025 [Candidatus Saccharimonadales bacterium]|nr:hypothetical protein [Candidatus Saccharimonadales bacterium]
MSVETEARGEQDASLHTAHTRAAALAAILLVAGCSNHKANTTPETTASTAIPTAHAASHAPSPACRLQGAGFESSLRTGADVVQLSRYLVGTAIDMAPYTTGGECYEQVTFRFSGQRITADLPGIHAHYVDKPIKQNPSDHTVRVAGNAFIEVNIGSWWYEFGGGDGPQTITNPNMDNVQAAQQTQNYEGVSTWVVGLETKRPFTITPLSGTTNCPQLCYTLKIQGQ